MTGIRSLIDTAVNALWRMVRTLFWLLPKVRAGAQERLSVTEARSRFGDKTRLSPVGTMTVQSFVLVPR